MGNRIAADLYQENPMTRFVTVTAISAAVVLSAFAQPYPTPQRDSRDRVSQSNHFETLPAGTQIKVRTDETIDLRDRSDGRIYAGTVAEDVMAPGGGMLIPRGAKAELIVQNLSDHDMAVDLESFTVEGHRYMVAAEAYNNSRRTGLGENKRTGKYVGGGALFGTIVGAIAGGGKGAAIGAVAGGAAGAGAQVLTKGQAIRVPAESLLSFRLEQPLQIATGRYQQDNGYYRDGLHYHDDYYNRPPNRFR
jgi:hypothetical protein